MWHNVFAPGFQHSLFSADFAYKNGFATSTCERLRKGLGSDPGQNYYNIKIMTRKRFFGISLSGTIMTYRQN